MKKSDTKEPANVTGLMFTWVGAISVDQRLFLVLQKILNVSHLMMDGDQILHVYLCAHLYSEWSGNKWAMGKILSKTFCTTSILRLWIKFKNTYDWTISTYSPSCYRSPRPRRGRPPPCRLAWWSYYHSRKSQACQSSQATGKTPPKF